MLITKNGHTTSSCQERVQIGLTTKVRTVRVFPCPAYIAVRVFSKPTFLFDFKPPSQGDECDFDSEEVLAALLANEQGKGKGLPPPPLATSDRAVCLVV